MIMINYTICNKVDEFNSIYGFHMKDIAQEKKRDPDAVLQSHMVPYCVVYCVVCNRTVQYGYENQLPTNPKRLKHDPGLIEEVSV